eukprot:6415114-Pyramimonas_sp.AAC.1
MQDQTLEAAGTEPPAGGGAHGDGGGAGVPWPHHERPQRGAPLGGAPGPPPGGGGRIRAHARGRRPLPHQGVAGVNDSGRALSRTSRPRRSDR